MLRGLLALAAALFAFAAPASAQRLIDLALNAPGVGALHVTVRLPAGYETGSRRYGVLYMHDGQNLFDPARSSYNKVWAVDRKLDELVAASKVDPVIVVAIDNPGEARWRTYLPAAVFARLLEAQRTAALTALAKGEPVQSDAYLRFIVDILKPQIDRDFRTLPDRAHTSIAGSSMGGLISLYAIAEYPQVFGAAACLSTHWPMTIPPTSIGTAEGRAIVAAWRSYLGEKLGPADGRRIWFDHGTATLDAGYPPYQAAIDRVFSDLGWRKGRDFASREYPGAEHEENAWARRLGDPLTFILAAR